MSFLCLGLLLTLFSAVMNKILNFVFEKAHKEFINLKKNPLCYGLDFETQIYNGRVYFNDQLKHPTTHRNVVMNRLVILYGIRMREWYGFKKLE